MVKTLNVSNKAIPLNTLPSGMCGVVAGMECAGEYAKRLAGHGIVKGASIKVMGRAPFGGLMRIEVMNTCISLREADAGRIFMTVVEKPVS